MEKLKRLIAVIKKRKTPLALIGLLVAAGLVAAAFWGKNASASDYITAKVERGNIEVNVSATGTVQAVTTVQVGSQVSGTVSWLGADFNSQVKKGQIVARLDPAVFQAQVDNSRANVVNSEAAVASAETDINNGKANVQAAKANQEVTRVQRDDALALVKRNEELKEVISARDIEASKAQAGAAAARYEQAVAQVGQTQAASASAKAKLDQAKASVTQAKAQLQQSQLNLDHSIIASPIDGVVVSRNVDVGQTVAASLQAPTLFTIANDLTKMQVLASVDEADVGQIKQGIKANFAVDAYPGETFSGEITQVRLNAQTLQNVVTYSAVIDVANPEMKLRPGMTANITVPVARKDGVLTIPNAALRFKPNLSEEVIKQKVEARKKQREAEKQQPEEAAQGQPAEKQQGQAQGENPQGQRRRDPQQGGQQGEGQQAGGNAAKPGGDAPRQRQGQQIWILTADGKDISPRFVRTGLTNGRVTEVVFGDVQQGDIVVTGQNDTSGSNRTQPSTTPLGQRPPTGGGGGRPPR